MHNLVPQITELVTILVLIQIVLTAKPELDLEVYVN